MDQEQNFKRILVAIDHTKFAAKAARTGFALARMVSGVVALVYVVDPAKEVVSADLGITPGQSETALLMEAERTIENYMQLYDGTCQVTRFTPLGIPEEEILRIADDWQADIIVMGTHGRSAIGRMLSGSKAEYIVRHARVPVLLSPPRMP